MELSRAEAFERYGIRRYLDPERLDVAWSLDDVARFLLTPAAVTLVETEAELARLEPQ